MSWLHCQNSHLSAFWPYFAWNWALGPSKSNPAWKVTPLTGVFIDFWKLSFLCLWNCCNCGRSACVVVVIVVCMLLREGRSRRMTRRQAGIFNFSISFSKHSCKPAAASLQEQRNLPKWSTKCQQKNAATCNIGGRPAAGRGRGGVGWSGRGKTSPS